MSKQTGDALTRLAYELADEAARSDIECHCSRAQVGPYCWYDTNPDDPDDAAWVARALQYLLMRGLVLRSRRMPSRIRFLPLTRASRARA